jgi:hypothetical protein
MTNDNSLSSPGLEPEIVAGVKARAAARRGLERAYSPVFDEAIVGQLLRALKVPEKEKPALPPAEIAAILNRIALNAADQFWREQTSSHPQDVLAAAAAIRDACAVILDSAGFFAGEPTPERLMSSLGSNGLFPAARHKGLPAPDATPESAVIDAFKAVHRLKGYAVICAVVAARQTGPRRKPPGRPPSKVAGMFVSELADLYISIWHKLPTASSEGRFARLLTAVQDHLRQEGIKIPSTPAGMLKTLEKQAKEDDLRQLLQSLEAATSK